MVKKTQRTYLFKAIKKNGISFFAVALIAATSIAIYLGIQSGAEAILQYAGLCFEENRLATSEITCAIGITQEDIDALAKQSEVDTVEGGYRTMALIDTPKEKITVQIRSLLRELNRPTVLEGTLPAEDNEVAIERQFALEQGAKVGDEIKIEHSGEFKNDTFIITAIINEPSFSCADVNDSRGKSEVGFGSASYYMEVTPDAFDTSYYNDCFTNAYIENKALCDIYFYSDEYEAKEKSILENLEAFGEERAESTGKSADGIRQNNWVVSGRNDMGDVRAVKTVVEGLFTLSYSFALIFLLVAIVVCYAAVEKMINDQRSLIGVQKALGLTPKEIFTHYLSYNILCAVLGIIIGCICSVLIVENLVLHIFTGEFVFEKIPLSFVYDNAIIVSVLCLLIFIFATFAGCTKVLKQSAISLLRGEMPTQQKAYFFESWRAYKHLSLYSRTMIKNVLNDKGRILTTVMGVVGCVSLLIITFTLKFAISNAPDRHFEKYFLFENRLTVNSKICELEDYEKILEQEDITFIRVQDKLKRFRVEDGNWENIHIVAVDDSEQIKDFIYLEDTDTKEALEIPTDGVLISKKCADNFDLQVGSTIELMGADGSPKKCKVAGVTEHYLPYHQIITSVDFYENLMGESADECVFLLKGDIDGLFDKVRDKDGFLSLKDNSEYMTSFASINLVIVICLCFSAILAVLVLLNQMNMYINKKSKEMKSNKKVIIAVCIICALCVIAVICILNNRKPNEEKEEYRNIQIYDVSGTVQIERTGTGSIDAYSGMMLQSGDVIETGADSYLYLKLDEDKYILLEPDSKACIVASGNMQDSKTYINLEKGAIVNRIDVDLSADSVYEINTPNSTMAVRGTNFRIGLESDENGIFDTELEVFEGEVLCEPKSIDGNTPNKMYCKSGKALKINGIEGNASCTESNENINYNSMSIETLKFLKEIISSGVDISISETELDTIISQKESETTTEETTTEEAAAEKKTTQKKQNSNATTTKKNSTTAKSTTATTTKQSTTTTAKQTTTTTTKQATTTTTESTTEKEAPTEEIPPEDSWSGSDSADSP